VIGFITAARVAGRRARARDEGLSIRAIAVLLGLLALVLGVSVASAQGMNTGASPVA